MGQSSLIPSRLQHKYRSPASGTFICAPECEKERSGAGGVSRRDARAAILRPQQALQRAEGLPRETQAHRLATPRDGLARERWAGISKTGREKTGEADEGLYLCGRGRNRKTHLALQ